MELAKEIIMMLKEIAWPIAILTISLIFRRPLISAVSALLPDEKKKQRNLKLKLGSFEIESQIEAKAQERLQAIAEEPSLQKRLQMAKEPFLVDEALKAIDEKGMEALHTLYTARLENAFYINWYKPEDYGINTEIFHTLSNLGLIKGTPMYDGDEIGFFTPTGIALLARMEKNKEASKITS